MAKYLFQGSYTAEGAKGLMKDGGTGRKAVIEQLIKSAGGKLEAFYFSFGEHDVVLVADCPDAASAAAISLAGSGTGAVQIKTTPLLTPEELDQATQKSLSYRPPGK
jgi:uncharacterized protein with GYD domain